MTSAAEALRRAVDQLTEAAVERRQATLSVSRVLARANRAQALEHFERALASDLADIQGGTTAEGVHLGAMAGSVELLQRSFAGLETRHGALWFNPRRPRSLGRLEFAVEYRGQPITVRVVGREVTVSNGPRAGGPVRIGCGEEVCELRPGETARFMAVGVRLDGPAAEAVATAARSASGQPPPKAHAE